ncbi:MAG TPA: response regulator [Bacteroidota bacterium]|nr:response regulator [Bacteroidota bacterium]
MSGKKIKILHLDDEDCLLKLTVDELRNEGYDAHGMDLKRQGFAWIIENKPDLVLSDINAPEIDGFTFLRMLRSDPRTRDTKVIMITGMSDLKTAYEAVQLGAIDFVSKPFDFKDLFKVIERALATPFVYTPTSTKPVATELVVPKPISKKKLVIVEKQGSWLRSICDRLGEENYQLTLVNSFEELLSLHLAEYNLTVLGGHQFGKRDALPELVSYLKARYPKMDVIVVSARAEIRHVTGSADGDSEAAVAVPYDLELIVKSLERMLANSPAV